MVNYDSYIGELNRGGFRFEANVVDHLTRKGHPASQSLFIRAALKELVERDDGPLSGIEPLLHDSVENAILLGVVDRLIDEYL